MNRAEQGPEFLAIPPLHQGRLSLIEVAVSAMIASVEKYLDDVASTDQTGHKMFEPKDYTVATVDQATEARRDEQNSPPLREELDKLTGLTTDELGRMAYELANSTDQVISRTASYQEVNPNAERAPVSGA